MPKWKVPPSGQTLAIFGVVLNSAPKEFLLQVIEWSMQKEFPPTGSNLLHYNDLTFELLQRADELRRDQNALK